MDSEEGGWGFFPPNFLTRNAGGEGKGLRHKEKPARRTAKPPAPGRDNRRRGGTEQAASGVDLGSGAGTRSGPQRQGRARGRGRAGRHEGAERSAAPAAQGRDPQAHKAPRGPAGAGASRLGAQPAPLPPPLRPGRAGGAPPPQECLRCPQSSGPRTPPLAPTTG